MTTWVYHPPANAQTPAPPGCARLEGAETLGARQAQLLLRARKSQGGLLVLTHDRASNRDRMAARRLVERELLGGPNYLGPARDGLYVYTLTSRGRSCWVRVKEER